jgi:hypothetical protein
MVVQLSLEPNAPYGYALAFRPVITAWDAFRFSLSGRSGSVALHKEGRGRRMALRVLASLVAQRYR